MDQLYGLLLAGGIIVIFFLLFPAAYGRTGGYSELASAFKAKRPRSSSAIYQGIRVQRGHGFLSKFTGVNFYFDKNGFYIFPMFKLWSWSMPTLFIPYERIEVKRVISFVLFRRTEISFPGSSLPKLSIPGKFYPIVSNAAKL